MRRKRGVEIAVLFTFVILLCNIRFTGASGSEDEDFGELSLEELLDVPVTAASREVKSAREAPAAVYVVTHTMIHERGYNYLFDALRDAPGFDIIWMGGLYGPVLMQHGLDTPENNKLILMIDGIVDNNLSAGTAQVYMQYSLHNVQRIEILYGPASALYGANAMTGLINIITKKGADLNGMEAQAGAVAWDSEFRRTGAAGAVVAGKVWGEEGRKVDLAGSFHIINTDGTDLRLSDLARSDNPEFPAAASYYFSPRYIGSSERGTFLAQGRALFESIGLTLGGHVWQHRGGQGTYGHEAFFLNAFQNKPDTWNYRNSTMFIEHSAPWTDTIANRARFVYRDTRILDDSYDATFNVPGSGPDAPGSPGLAGSRYLRPDHSVLLEDSVKWDFRGKMSLTAGASVELQRVSDYQLSLGHSFDDQVLLDPGTKPVIDESRMYDYDDYSAFFEHAWRITPEFSLTTGMRVDNFRLQGDRTPLFFGTKDYDENGNCVANAPDCKSPEEAAAAGAVEVSNVYYVYSPFRQNRSTFNPRIGAVYSRAGSKLTLKALYGEGFRMPTVRELFSVTASRYSNPQLGPEKIHTVEFGGVYEFTGHGFLEVDAFFTNASDIVQLTTGNVKRPGRTSLLNQFQNVSHAHIYGFDVQTQLKLTPIIDIFGYYSFQVPRYEDTDAANLSHDPLTLSLADTEENIPRQARHKGTFGAVLHLWNRRLILSPRLNWVGSRPSVVTSPLQDVDGYASFNLSATLKDAGARGLWIQFTGYNFGSVDMLDPGFRTGNKFNDFPAAHPRPGFHFYLNAGYAFNFI